MPNTEEKHANRTKKKIAVSFQVHLLLIVFLSFLLASVLLWILLTGAGVKITEKSLLRGIDDIRLDIDQAALTVADQVVSDLFTSEGDALPTQEMLAAYAEENDIAEINYIDPDGMIRASNIPEYIGSFNMREKGQSADFDRHMNEGNGDVVEYVQASGAISYDETVHRKYAGISLERGGYAQIGFSVDRNYQNRLDDLILSVSRNRHIGAEGGFIIANPDTKVISVPDDTGALAFTEEDKQNVSALLSQKLDPSKIRSLIQENINGGDYLFMFDTYDGYYIITFLPEQEVNSSRTITTTIMSVILLLTMITLFYFIYRLINKSIISTIRSVNSSLQKINSGELDTKVEARDNHEFDLLSTNINQTVSTLNKYIDEANKRIDDELSYAKLIQKSSLPSVYPPFPGRNDFDICGGMKTAKEVGGDFYDYFFINETTLCFLIADVSGKGIPAAMFMMRARSALKSYAQRGLEPAEVFRIVNNALCENNEANMFVTVWMGWMNTQTGEVRYINAGHNHPLLKKAGAGYEYIRERSGMILAAIEGKKFTEHTICLAPNDSLLLYTDGITEACDTENREYGEERLKEHMNSMPDSLNAEKICVAVMQGADAFTGDAPQFDDMTVLNLIFKGDAL